MGLDVRKCSEKVAEPSIVQLYETKSYSSKPGSYQMI